MTDIAQLGFEVDSGPVRSGAAALTDLSKSARESAKQVGVFDSSSKSAGKSATGLALEIGRIGTGLKKTTSGFVNLTNSTERADSAIIDASKSIRTASRDVEDFDTAVDDANFSAEEFGSSFYDMASAVNSAKRPFIDLSKSARDAAMATGLANAQFEYTGGAIPKINPSAEKASSRFKNLGASAGRAGVQVQQLVGQISAGQSPMLALSQQAADLGIVLGAPLVGVLVSLGATLGGVVASAFMGASSNAEDLLDRIDDLSDGFNDLTDAQRAYVRFKLSDQIAEQEGAVADLDREINNLNDSIDRNIMITESQGRQYADSQSLARQQLQKQREDLVTLEALRDTEQQDLDTLRERLDLVTGSRKKSSDEIDRQAESVSELVDGLREEVATLGLSDREKSLRTARNNSATDSQIQLINALYDSIDAYEAEQEAIRQQEASLREYINSVEAAATADAKRAAAREASADAQIEAIGRQVSATIGALKTEEELVDEWYQNSVSMLEAANEQELAIIGGYNEAKLRLEEEYQRRKNAITEDGSKTQGEIWQENLDLTSSAMDSTFSEFAVIAARSFDDMSEKTEASLGALGQSFDLLKGIAQAGGEESFKAYKQLAMAEAAIAGALAFTKALAAAPPPFNFALAGAVAASTLVQVATIDAQEYNGAREMGGQVQSGQSYLVGERGPEILQMGSQGGHITPNHRVSANDEISVTNVFQISTGVQETVRAELIQLAPTLAEQSKRSVLEAINSGGPMARATRRRA